MNYAIIETGGKQYKVKEGDIITVERINSPGHARFDKVLFISSEAGFKIGQPYIKGAKVTADVVGEEKGKKVTMLKYRRRKSSRRKKGHRQIYTKVKIDKIAEG